MLGALLDACECTNCVVTVMPGFVVGGLICHLTVVLLHMLLHC
jgi:hypothetical protein